MAAGQAARPCSVRNLPLWSPEGHQLPARLHCPAGDGPHPGVLLVPGGLEGARSVEAGSSVITAQLLARRGVATLVFTPSGREGAPGPNDRNGPLHQAECGGALALLFASPEVDADRCVVLSLSFGVVMALGALVARPDLGERVREAIDWEGPGSRRWFEGVKIGEPSDNEDFWGPREAVTMAPSLPCAYRRVQSAHDHVHGHCPEIGVELARAAWGGRAPRVLFNDQEGPFDDGFRPELVASSLPAQCSRLLGWAGLALSRSR